MMKKICLLLAVLPVLTSAQDNTFGSSTTFFIGSQATFFTQGNTNFEGILVNNGQIVSEGGLASPNDLPVGDLEFVGDEGRTVSGTNLIIEDFIVNTGGNIILNASSITVQNNLNLTSGKVIADDPNDLFVLGNIVTSRQGYVEGYLGARKNNAEITFPMGIDDNLNFITFSGADSGNDLLVLIQKPNPIQLIPGEDIQGLADEVEWVVSTDASTADVNVSVNFSGVDLENLPNGQSIRSEKYAPSLELFQEGDSAYQSLTISSLENLDNENFPTSGTIVTSDVVTLSQMVSSFVIGSTPIQLKPAFYVPNAFAPEGEFEENRQWRFYYTGAEITRYSLEIFDSFNTRVHSVGESGSDLDISTIGWDGILPSGQQAPEGIY